MKKKHSDWRLPTFKELLTLVNEEKYNPACDLKDTIADYYWSSTVRTCFPDYAWTVNFYSGSKYFGTKDTSLYVRCVRDGKEEVQWSKGSEYEMSWNEASEYAEGLVTETYYKGKENE